MVYGFFLDFILPLNLVRDLVMWDCREAKLLAHREVLYLAPAKTCEIFDK